MAEAPEPTPRPHAGSLCHRCAACRTVPGRATVFLLCTALARKYPPQPVLACAAFRPGKPGAARGDAPA